MSIYRRGGIYWYKFMWRGELIRESTKQGNDKVARQMEAAHRTSLAKGEVGIRQKKAAPTLAEFLKNDFLPFVQAHFSSKPKTAVYYNYGVKLLLASDLGGFKLDEVTSQHSGGFMARNSKLSASTINCGLRTLRRALNLASEWGKLQSSPKIVLSKGERRRERILTEAEFFAYRDACRQPWHDVVTLLFGTAMRPGEAYQLRWEHVLLDGKGGMIQVADGKSRAARRVLPIVPEVYHALLARWEAQGRPAEGWVFPSGSASGRLEESSAKIQHADAVNKLQSANDTYKKWANSECRGPSWHDEVSSQLGLESGFVARHADVIKAGLKSFQPYCLRHTALTRLAEAGCDAFTLARIAGHSSITITQRYCHPGAESVERAFARLSGHKNGHNENLLPASGIGESTVIESAQKG